MFHLIQPGGRASREVGITPAAPRGQVRAGSSSCQCSHGWRCPRGPGRHQTQAGVGVSQTGEQGSREARQRSRGGSHAKGAAGPQLTVGLRTSQTPVLQWEASRSPCRSAQGWCRLPQAAIKAIRRAHVGHSRLICKKSRRGSKWVLDAQCSALPFSHIGWSGITCISLVRPDQGLEESSHGSWNQGVC